MINSALGFIILFVHNPYRSAQFYEQLFGVKPVEKSPTFVLFALKGGAMLGLWSRHTADPAVTAQPGAMELSFAVDDVDATYDTIGGAGITVIQKPTDMDFGRAFTIIDPDGHRIRFYKLRDR